MAGVRATPKVVKAFLEPRCGSGDIIAAVAYVRNSEWTLTEPFMPNRANARDHAPGRRVKSSTRSSTSWNCVATSPARPAVSTVYPGSALWHDAGLLALERPRGHPGFSAALPPSCSLRRLARPQEFRTILRAETRLGAPIDAKRGAVSRVARQSACRQRIGFPNERCYSC